MEGTTDLSAQVATNGKYVPLAKFISYFCDATFDVVDGKNANLLGTVSCTPAIFCAFRTDEQLCATVNVPLVLEDLAVNRYPLLANQTAQVVFQCERRTHKGPIGFIIDVRKTKSLP